LGEQRTWEKVKNWAKKMENNYFDKRKKFVDFRAFRRFFQAASRCTLTNILLKIPKA
jgi:hypothetical protein